MSFIDPPVAYRALAAVTILIDFTGAYLMGMLFIPADGAGTVIIKGVCITVLLHPALGAIAKVHILIKIILKCVLMVLVAADGAGVAIHIMIFIDPQVANRALAAVAILIGPIGFYLMLM